MSAVQDERCLPVGLMRSMGWNGERVCFGVDKDGAFLWIQNHYVDVEHVEAFAQFLERQGCYGIQRDANGVRFTRVTWCSRGIVDCELWELANLIEDCA